MTKLCRQTLVAGVRSKQALLARQRGYALWGTLRQNGGAMKELSEGVYNFIDGLPVLTLFLHWKKIMRIKLLSPCLNWKLQRSTECQQFRWCFSNCRWSVDWIKGTLAGTIAKTTKNMRNELSLRRHRKNMWCPRKKMATHKSVTHCENCSALRHVARNYWNFRNFQTNRDSQAILANIDQ